MPKGIQERTGNAVVTYLCPWCKAPIVGLGATFSLVPGSQRQVSESRECKGCGEQLSITHRLTEGGTYSVKVSKNAEISRGRLRLKDKG